jgi:hypothetical protein
MRPQLGSPPKIAALVRLEPATLLATTRASASLAAPVTWRGRGGRAGRQGVSARALCVAEGRRGRGPPDPLRQGVNPIESTRPPRAIKSPAPRAPSKAPTPAPHQQPRAPRPIKSPAPPPPHLDLHEAGRALAVPRNRLGQPLGGLRRVGGARRGQARARPGRCLAPAAACPRALPAARPHLQQRRHRGLERLAVGAARVGDLGRARGAAGEADDGVVGAGVAVDGDLGGRRRGGGEGCGGLRGLGRVLGAAAGVRAARRAPGGRVPKRPPQHTQPKPRPSPR